MIIREVTLEDTEYLAKIHVDSWRDAYSGIIPDDYLSKLSYEKSKNAFDNMIKNKINNHLLVEYNNKIVGFSSFGKELTNNYPDKGEIFAIYILKEYRGKGLGKNLFMKIVEEFKKQNIHSLMLWTLVENKYKYFYESLGGKILDYKYMDFGSKKLKLVAYTWDF